LWGGGANVKKIISQKTEKKYWGSRRVASRDPFDREVSLGFQVFEMSAKKRRTSACEHIVPKREILLTDFYFILM
jgi:hypothetical protein